MMIFSCLMVSANLLVLIRTPVEDSHRTDCSWSSAVQPVFIRPVGYFESSLSILITTDELISILNKRWGVPKSTVKRLFKEHGIDSEFEIFADGIKRSYKAVAIEDFLVSVYEHRPIFSTDVFGWAISHKEIRSGIQRRFSFIFQSSQWRNIQIDLFIAANAHWGNQQAGQKIPRLQQVWNHWYSFIILSMTRRKPRV